MLMNKAIAKLLPVCLVLILVGYVAATAGWTGRIPKSGDFEHTDKIDLSVVLVFMREVLSAIMSQLTLRGSMDRFCVLSVKPTA